VLTELKNRGVEDVLITVRDGLIGIAPEAAPKERFGERAAEWGGRYPPFVRL
jgi:transposase-like protein